MFEESIIEWIDCLERDLKRAYKELRDRLPHHPRCRRYQVKQVLTQIVNNQKFIIMPPLNLVNGNQAPILESLVDAKTLAPIPGATKVNKSRTSDTPAVAVVDANGNLVSVAPGTGNLTTVNTWTYIDQDTNETVTQDETTTMPFVVSVTPEGVLQVVILGTASAIPASTAS